MISELSSRILLNGLDDWVPLLAVHGLARQLGAVEDSEAAEASIASIQELLAHHLVELGNASVGTDFLLDEDPDDLKLSRIANAMRNENRESWGFLYWLRNTSGGDELAKATRN